MYRVGGRSKGSEKDSENGNQSRIPLSFRCRINTQRPMMIGASFLGACDHLRGES
jgi:hypothetical protein